MEASGFNTPTTNCRSGPGFAKLLRNCNKLLVTWISNCNIITVLEIVIPNTTSYRENYNISVTLPSSGRDLCVSASRPISSLLSAVLYFVHNMLITHLPAIYLHS